MTRRALALAAVVGINCLLVGCSQISKAPGSGPVNVTAADDGKTLKLAPNTVVRITLASNVTTGYSWKLLPLKDGVVERTSQEYIAPESPAAGAGGKEVWTFTTRAAGQVKLRLEYVRPWETNVLPANTFEVTIEVKGG